jgi:hypothetical protein
MINKIGSHVPEVLALAFAFFFAACPAIVSAQGEQSEFVQARARGSWRAWSRGFVFFFGRGFYYRPSSAARPPKNHGPASRRPRPSAESLECFITARPPRSSAPALHCSRRGPARAASPGVPAEVIVSLGATWERGADSALGRGLREAGPWVFGGRAALLGL